MFEYCRLPPRNCILVPNYEEEEEEVHIYIYIYCSYSAQVRTIRMTALGRHIECAHRVCVRGSCMIACANGMATHQHTYVAWQEREKEESGDNTFTHSHTHRHLRSMTNNVFVCDTVIRFGSNLSTRRLSLCVCVLFACVYVVCVCVCQWPTDCLYTVSSHASALARLYRSCAVCECAVNKQSRQPAEQQHWKEKLYNRGFNTKFSHRESSSYIFFIYKKKKNSYK